MGEQFPTDDENKAGSRISLTLEKGKFGHQDLHPLHCKFELVRLNGATAVRFFSMDAAHAIYLGLFLLLVDGPDPKGNLENAHHPKHEVDIHLYTDQEMLDRLRSELFKHPAKQEEKMLKTSAWIHPELHQELTDRPTESDGRCGDHIVECPRRKPSIVVSWPEEKDHYHHVQGGFPFF